MNYWETEIHDWLLNKSNHDQDAVGKNKFIRSARSGPITSLYTLGISNPALQKKSKLFYKENKEMGISELLSGLNRLYIEAKYTETRLLVFFILERYKKLITPNSEMIFALIDQNWIDLIDHWTTSDHLCINIFAHIELNEKMISSIYTWSKSANFWRNRLSITVFLKMAKTHPEYLEHVFEMIDRQNDNKNYYVKKARPWLLSVYGAVNPRNVKKYIRENIEYFNKTELRESIKNLDETFKEEMLELYQSNHRK